MQKRMLKIANDMAKVRKDLKSGKMSRIQGLAIARVAEVEIRALVAAATI